MICPIVEIETSGPLGAAQPGIYVDGAHLYVKRASNPTSYATWNVPVIVIKAVKTFVNRWDWQSGGYDLYTLAQNCDSMVVGEADGAFAARMKYLNPNIRTYLYQIYACLDQRDSRGIDVWYSASPTQMGWLLNNNHRDWLWANGVGGFVSAPSGPYLYDMHVANSDYQSYWVGVAQAKALRWKHQGVFMDSMIPMIQVLSGAQIIQPERDPWGIQRFLHGVVPSLDSAGLTVAGNMGGYNVSKDPCDVYFNPRWTPAAPYNTSNYTSNQPSNTPNIAFQEWGFIRPSGGAEYDSAYWLSCLQDMDTVKSWNTNADGSLVPANQRMYYVVEIEGADVPSDPAAGVNGWFQYGLASYLLAQNDWTYFSWLSTGRLLDGIDYSSTANLASPAGDRASVNGDPYFLYRNYTTADGRGEVVVVNGNDGPNGVLRLTASDVYALPWTALDENGNVLAGGTQIVLPPHTGRIFIKE